ncbi:unnamed protein product [Prorocentrum cordatum]|uniref:Methionine adenosyltransferase 2 subunit beta n=1 Tax=Prorocentrum cordatum TaxID=2364126 RepID=A0ABN9VZZ4_9DINO|nr:unnamed protein product [Polarella glacialis]
MAAAGAAELFRSLGRFGGAPGAGGAGGAGGAAAPAAPAVLVLGGSTFMGRETVAGGSNRDQISNVEALLACPARVCTVNRGRSYWGVEDASGGRAARALADRDDAGAFAARLDQVTERLGVGRWALVADFSAYSARDMQASLAGLKGRFDTYVFVSSDSVYEVSAWAASGWGPRSTPGVAEAAAERPADQEARRRLRRADSYGDGKLQAEEALAAGVGQSPGCRGLALRLPDVIGPFDDTHRLWAYWHWLQAGPEDPPQSHAASSKRDVPLAFVFSRDVARFIAGLVGAALPADGPRCDALNLACDQQPALPELLGLLARSAGLAGPPPLAEVPSPKRSCRAWSGRFRWSAGACGPPTASCPRRCARCWTPARSGSAARARSSRARPRRPRGSCRPGLAGRPSIRAGLAAASSTSSSGGSSSGSDSEEDC